MDGHYLLMLFLYLFSGAGGGSQGWQSECSALGQQPQNCSDRRMRGIWPHPPLQKQAGHPVPLLRVRMRAGPQACGIAVLTGPCCSLPLSTSALALSSSTSCASWGRGPRCLPTSPEASGSWRMICEWPLGHRDMKDRSFSCQFRKQVNPHVGSQSWA